MAIIGEYRNRSLVNEYRKEFHMAGQYSSCPNCNNSKKGAVIRQCEKCGKIFCSACEKYAFLASACPQCQAAVTRKLGEVR